jgi:hypothetical protein
MFHRNAYQIKALEYLLPCRSDSFVSCPKLTFVQDRDSAGPSGRCNEPLFFIKGEEILG